MDTVQGGEVYNLIIRGGNEGGLDGIDVWGFNMYIHDVEVTNKDECVTVKASFYRFVALYYDGRCLLASPPTDIWAYLC